jgi:2-polyprenyl-3-methyl-5-hydroxy-6-metoxy-1,4-benzoquinol methylase
MADRWNHNIHYHPVVLDALPPEPDCRRVLDAGCGEGALTLELSRRAKQVVGIDLDGPSLELARQHAAAAGVENVDWVLGDFVYWGADEEPFDAVVSVAAVHHMGTAPALTRMAQLLRPGGRLAVVGIARSASPADLPWDLAGMVATRVRRLGKTFWETSAPKLWPPPETYAECRRVATTVLPGARFRRHALWRYTVTWTKPER